MYLNKFHRMSLFSSICSSRIPTCMLVHFKRVHYFRLSILSEGIFVQRGKILHTPEKCPQNPVIFINTTLMHLKLYL